MHRLDLIRNPKPHKRVTYLVETLDRDGQLHGEYGQWFICNGRRRVRGGWKHGLKHGRWRVWNARGRLVIDELYVDGKRQRGAAAQKKNPPHTGPLLLLHI